jgi:hypothetical protein
MALDLEETEKACARSQMLAAQADREFIRSPFFRAPAIGQS